MRVLNGFLLISCLLASLHCIGCNADQEPPVDDRSVNPLPYQFGEPSEIFKLSDKLREISGISYRENFLYAIQDENGVIFKLDPANGKIEKKITFWKDGDYEGIEVVDDRIYILKSSGTLYEVIDPGKDEQEVIKHNTFLDKTYNAEGLGYDASNNRLLISCKAKAGEGPDYANTKGIFAFSMDKKQLSPKPVILIDAESVHAYLKTNPNIRKLEQLMEFFQPGESPFSFGPSGIAIHPITKQIYITSAVGNVLIVLSPDGKSIVHIEKLRTKWMPQAEGIAFDPAANLYISTEGKGGDGKILRFDYQPQ